MTILVAPTAFKGTYSAVEAASLIASAVHGIPCPVADGGDGTLEVLHRALGGRRIVQHVTGPLGASVDAEILLAGRVAVIEMASASGLNLLRSSDRDPLRARTWGVGQLMRAAGDREIWLGVGGSATVDGGIGALAELDVLGPTPDPRGLAILRRTKILCDVRTRFLDAPRIFGPQKGAGPREVRTLERWMRDWARMLPRDIRSLEGGGAAGGLAGGLAAFGAHLVRGADFILGKIGFAKMLKGADLVITGEGRFDATSMLGKAPGAVIEAARRKSIPAIVVCGKWTGVRRPPGVVGIIESRDPFQGGKKAMYTFSRP